MDARIAFAPGAEENALARWACARIRDNVATNERAKADFFAMRAAVVLVAPDLRVQATLRFDHGHLTAHDGIIGIPDLTLCADDEALRALADLPSWRGLPDLRSSRWRELMLELTSGEVRIYGLVSHPRLTHRVLRVLGRPR